jgi:hypothetical protein
MEIYTGRLPRGFAYIPQDSYTLCHPESDGLDYLYSDSATSCIIIIAVGKDKNGQPLIAFSHLSRPARFKAFFKLIESNFDGATSIYAQGANPASPVTKGKVSSYDAPANAFLLLDWIAKKSYTPAKGAGAPSSFYIQQCSLSLGTGDPNKGVGSYGIDVNPKSENYLHASNKYFNVTAEDRDPSHGVQLLFCVFGMEANMSSLVIRDYSIPFSDTEITELVRLAKKHRWNEMLESSEAEILNEYSSTPEFEPHWFVDSLIQSAKYVISFSK